MKRYAPKLCYKCQTAVLRTPSLSFVCPNCGIEIFTDMFEQSKVGIITHNELQNQYSKNNRFKSFLRNVLGITFSPNAKKPIWNFLKKVDTIEKLIKMLASSKLKSKHYESIHSYAKVFLTSYTEPTALSLLEIKHIEKLFDDVYCAFSMTFGPKSVFFSYPWLLYTILSAIGKHEYLQYIKNLKCKKRSFVYVQKLKQCTNYMLDSGRHRSCYMNALDDHCNKLLET